MRRIALLVTVAMVMGVVMLYSGVAWAANETSSCMGNVAANPSGSGTSEPGETGTRARIAEENRKEFGQATTEVARTPGDCGETVETPGPPGPFDPHPPEQ
jgi:hypothetical protein